MRTPYPEIRRCFDAKLLDLLPGLGLESADVAWPNASFEPVVGKPYLRPWCMFGKTAAATLGPHGFERMPGVYQISVMAVLGEGMEWAENTARTLVDHFRGGTWLVCCGFDVCISAAYAGTAMREEDRLHIPVSVVWRCDTQK